LPRLKSLCNLRLPPVFRAVALGGSGAIGTVISQILLHTIGHFMSYDLTINRFGALAGALPNAIETGGLRGPELVLAFRSQTERLSKIDEFRWANEQILKVVQETCDPDAMEIRVQAEPTYDNAPDVFAVTPEDETASFAEAPKDTSGARAIESLAGILPYSKLKCRIADFDWVIRTRASMTACALQEGAGRPKLWWSFEGIPLVEEGGPLPSETQAKEFVALTDRMAKQAMPLLRDAYWTSIEPIKERRTSDFDLNERIRISLADNNTRPVAELLDAVYFYHWSVDRIKQDDGQAKTGLDELNTFIGDITNNDLTVHNSRLEVATETAGAKAVICSRENTNQFASLVAGFARRAGSRDGFEPRPQPWLLPQREQYVRVMSPAREISAQLADREARKLDRKVGELQDA
jgi:hypothetical protein